MKISEYNPPYYLLDKIKNLQNKFFVLEERKRNWVLRSYYSKVLHDSSEYTRLNIQTAQIRKEIASLVSETEKPRNELGLLL